MEVVDYSLLGTVVRLRVRSKRFVSSRRLRTRAMAEIRRLEAIFNIFDPTSAISTLRETGETSDRELAHVRALADDWCERTGGLFDSNATGQLDLNGIAKGWIVDRAAETIVDRCHHVVINAGGDILHRGTGSVRAGIEDPNRPFDNVRPGEWVEVSNGAIATSGSSRRGDHLIRPAGQDHIASASVVASDAASADALATALAVSTPELGLAIAQQEAVAALLVTVDGVRLSNERWRAIELTA